MSNKHFFYVKFTTGNPFLMVKDVKSKRYKVITDLGLAI